MFLEQCFLKYLFTEEITKLIRLDTNTVYSARSDQCCNCNYNQSLNCDKFSEVFVDMTILEEATLLKNIIIIILQVYHTFSLH